MTYVTFFHDNLSFIQSRHGCKIFNCHLYKILHWAITTKPIPYPINFLVTHSLRLLKLPWMLLAKHWHPYLLIYFHEIFLIQPSVTFLLFYSKNSNFAYFFKKRILEDIDPKSFCEDLCFALLVTSVLGCARFAEILTVLKWTRKNLEFRHHRM